MQNKSPPKEPITVNTIASYAFPASNNLCPGNMDIAVSSFGAPKKTLGMKSKNVWVMHIEIMNTDIVTADTYCIRKGEIDNATSETIFTWSPGVKPVIIPIHIPINIAINISRIIFPTSWLNYFTNIYVTDI